jgi:hypothetical protein
MDFAFKLSRFINLFESPIVKGFSLPSLPIVCFAPVMLVMPVVKSMSSTFSHVNSIGRCPKSLDIDNFRFRGNLTCWIMKSICSSFGA